MRVVVQRVTKASVAVEGKLISEIKQGLLVLVGIMPDDHEEDVRWLSSKIVQMRIFDDENGVMNLSVKDVGGEILAVSQFTLHASTKKGNRPSYIKAAKPEIAVPLYEQFLLQLATDLGNAPQQGIFGAAMKIDLCNDGPVTILIDSKNKE